MHTYQPPQAGKAIARSEPASLPPLHDALLDDAFPRAIISDTASVRYRKPGAFCETTPGVQEFVRFVDLDKEAVGNATARYFFWFTEARHEADTAPLTIWLNGRPGSGSLLGLFGGIFPTELI